MIAAKPITFRLYPEGRYRYCLVSVWPDHRAMIKHVGHDKEGTGKRTQGMHTSTECWLLRGGKLHKTGMFGRINLHLGQLTIEYAAHEIAHAAVAWSRRVGIDPLSCTGQEVAEPEDNERFCYAMGSMVQQFTNQAYRRGVWK